MDSFISSFTGMNSPSLTTIHNCVQTALENDYFRQKLTEYYKENKRLKQTVAELVDKLKEPKLVCKSNQYSTHTQTDQQVVNKDSCTSKPPVSRCCVCSKRPTSQPKFRNRQVQTEEKPVERGSSQNKTDKEVFNQQNKKSYVKLCDMHHNLLKKYEEEVNAGAVKQDLIQRMKSEIDELDGKCKAYENRIASLNTQLENMQCLESRYKSLEIDLASVKMKCDKYKKSLSRFDDSFFAEIEALKKRHDESVNLNKYYEYLLFRSDKENLILKNLKEKKNRVKFADEQVDSLTNDCLNWTIEPEEHDEQSSSLSINGDPDIDELDKLIDAFKSIETD